MNIPQFTSSSLNGHLNCINFVDITSKLPLTFMDRSFYGQGLFMLSFLLVRYLGVE